ncbi:MAG: tyrosine-protein phosphatase [Candidatus Latescibacteria bacterium]|nr:tyrosine-protein phosphatase [Candidatus Latescibacterota bacterium]
MSTHTPASRHLPWERCYNARDVGGYETGDGARTRWRSLVRADDLCRLTPAGCAALLDYGVRTIIDLRLPSECARALHPFASRPNDGPSLIYHHISMMDETDREGTARINAGDTPQEIYILILEQYPSSVAAAVRAFAQAGPGGVLVHCHGGKDRTGILVALLLTLAGVPQATIAQDYAESEDYLQPSYREALAQIAHDPVRHQQLARQIRKLAPTPEAMRATLSHLDTKHGGVSAYLKATGVTPEDLESIRNRLRET